MGSYTFDPKSKSNYVLVQISLAPKLYWNGTDFTESLDQATRYENYGQAAQAMYKLDSKFVIGRIVPMPLSALL